MNDHTYVKLHRQRVGKKPPKPVWKLVWWGLRDGARAKFQQTIGHCHDMNADEAELLRAKKETDLNSGRTSPNKPRRISLERFLEQDRENEASRSKPRSIDELKTAGNHALRILGEKSIQKIEHKDALRIRNNLAKHVSPATVGKVMAKLHAAFGRAVDQELIDRNPFDKVKLPKVQDRPVAIFKPDEAEALLDAAERGWWQCRNTRCKATEAYDDVVKCPACGTAVRPVVPGLWWSCLVQLAYTSGLRKGELLNLTWADLDLEPGKGEVRVMPKRAGTFTADGSEYPILAWDAKDYENRTIPIPDATVEMLQQLQDHQEPPRSVYVFLSLERLREVKAYMAAHGGNLSAHYALVNNMDRRWQEILSTAMRRMGRQFKAHKIHDLRRSFGSVQAQRLAIHELKVLMGHSSIITTQKYYLAPSDELADKVRGAYDPTSAD
ncbi:MAG: tyrosine-type recombinase/integrase [Planctomycetota bacterium]|jgi:integrase